MQAQPICRAESIDGVGTGCAARWTVFVELPVDEAYASLPFNARYGAVGRLVFAVLAGIFLARRMVVPIQALRAGAERIGSGDLSQRIEVKPATNWKVWRTSSTTWAPAAGILCRLEKKVDQRTQELAQSVKELRASAR